MDLNFVSRAVPRALAAVGAAVFVLWVFVPWQYANIDKRVPGMDLGYATTQTVKPPVDLKGIVTKGTGTAANLPGAWPCFRGEKLDGIAIEGPNPEPMPLARQFKSGAPPKLWQVELGEGYAGPAILHGRVYILDYDQKAKADVLRCLSLNDGKEIWRRGYSIDIPRNHGISRTVPAVTDKWVITLGPKCHVVCVDATSGDYKWGIDLVKDYQTTVPQWYAGQCPVIDGDRVILAPGGTALLMAVDCETGKVIWQTPNPRHWEMTHSSVMPMIFKGKKTYIYCASRGVVGVSAEDGAILWETTDWKVNMANVPTPVIVGEDRIFLSGGYGAGSMMLKLTDSEGKIVPSAVFRLTPDKFGAEQHTPILYQDHIYGLIPPTGQLACLDLNGKQLWTSGAKYKFGLGPFMVADGTLICLSEKGKLVLVEPSPAGFKPLAQADVIKEADEAWGPLALAGGRLIVRDLTKMVCLDLRKVANE
jgi:outer membrane protein assembly factor BamB